MVQGMFNDIAPKYDLLNHLLSADIDKIWRKKLRKKLTGDNPKMILDVASGTGDLAIELAKMPVDKIIGIDIAADMLEVGKIKVRKKRLESKIELREGDSESIDFDDEYFDAVTVAFGVRNYENLGKGLKEMQRVLKPGGKLVLLNMSKPDEKKTFYETIYKWSGIPCRPVLMAPYLKSLSFMNVQRAYRALRPHNFYERLIGLLWGQEIVLAQKAEKMEVESTPNLPPRFSTVA